MPQDSDEERRNSGGSNPPPSTKEPSTRKEAKDNAKQKSVSDWSAKQEQYHPLRVSGVGELTGRRKMRSGIDVIGFIFDITDNTHIDGRDSP